MAYSINQELGEAILIALIIVALKFYSEILKKNLMSDEMSVVPYSPYFNLDAKLVCMSNDFYELVSSFII